jgi:uncharacterized protein
MTDIASQDGAHFAPAWVHTAGDIPERGLEVAREATQEERDRLAAALDARGCPSLHVAYKILPKSGGRYRASGRIAATIVQRCVVSLAPVTTTLDEPLDVEFRPLETEAAENGHGDPAADFNRDYEPMRRGIIDIGRVVFEQIAATLDPYPRAAGATFQWTDPKQTADPAAGQGGDTGGNDNPFAVLRRLKGDG